MSAGHLEYYRRYSAVAGLVFWWSALRSRSAAARQSLINRQKDYRGLEHQAELLVLHHALNRHLLAARREWSSHDYGAGYFYQSCAALGIRGLRDTEARVQAMDLCRRLRGKSVLEIGCNTGFLSVLLAESAAEIVAFDINPHLIEIARLAAQHLDRDNVSFQAAAFEDWTDTRRYDAVLSFANHSTYDGNTAQSIREYFRRCRRHLLPGGHLLFESHAPDYEGRGLDQVLAVLSEQFEIEEQRVLNHGTFLDRGRTFVVARVRRAREADA